MGKRNHSKKAYHQPELKLVSRKPHTRNNPSTKGEETESVA